MQCGPMTDNQSINQSETFLDSIIYKNIPMKITGPDLTNQIGGMFAKFLQNSIAFMEDIEAISGPILER